MDKISKIKAEIERLRDTLPWGACASQLSMECHCKNEAYTEIEDFIESLQEEPVIEDLEEASNNYAESEEKRVGCGTEFFTPELAKAFKAGSQWQKKQFEKNRLAACDAQTKEEADREWNFVEEMINEEHRQPTYSDAIEYGMRGMKQQMMKDAIDAVMHPDDGEIWVDKKDLEIYYEGLKVKVIIIKEE